MAQLHSCAVMLFKLIQLINCSFPPNLRRAIFCGPQSDTADLRAGSLSRARGGVGRSCRDCPVTLSPIVHQSYTVALRSIFNPRLLSFCRDCVCRSGQIVLTGQFFSEFPSLKKVRGQRIFDLSLFFSGGNIFFRCDTL